MSNAFSIGDKVMVDPDAGWARDLWGVELEVTDVPRGAKGVNYKTKRTDGNGAGARGPASALLPYDADAAADLARGMVPYVPGPDFGSIVTIDSPKVDADALFYAEKPGSKPNTTRVLELGSARYIASFPNNRIRTVAAPSGGWTRTALGLDYVTEGTD